MVFGEYFVFSILAVAVSVIGSYFIGRHIEKYFKEHPSSSIYIDPVYVSAFSPYISFVILILLIKLMY